MGLIPSKTIRSRLLQILIIAIGSVVAILAAVWHFTVVPALRMGVARQQQEIARRAADQIEQFIDERVERLVAAAQIGRLWEMKKESQKEALYRLLKLDPQLHEIRVIDPTGREILRFSRSRVYTDADLTSFAQDEKFQQAMKGGTYIGPVYHARTSEPFITLAVPIKFTAREIKGVIVAEVTLKSLWDSISYIKVGKSGHAFVVDGKGNLIAHPDYSKVLLGTNLSHLQEVREFLSHASQNPDFGEEVIGKGGRKTISTFAVTKRLNWAVMVEEPIETALAEVRTVEQLGIFLLLIVTGAAFLISYFFSERIARPMRELEQGARLIAQGDLGQKLDIHSGDEIESLAHQFNRMAQALKESYQGLEEKIAERTRDLSALYAALAPLGSTDTDQMLQKVAERLKEATHADAALIRIFDKEAKSFLYPAHVGFPSSYLEATRELEPGSAIGTAFMTGEPIIAADVAEDPRLKSKRQLGAGFRSCAFLPLRVLGEFRGIVHLVSRELGHFNEEKKDHLMAIARQMGVAMENRELFEETERRAQEQATLSAIATATSQSLNLDELLQISLDRVLDVTGREQGYIRLKDPVTGKLRLAAHRGVSKEYIEVLLHRRTRGGKGDQVFESGEVLVINDPEGVPLKEETRREGRHSLIWVPLKARGKVVGLLNISTNRPIPFAPREVELLQAIGNVIGVALENARLFQETEQRVRQQEALNVIAMATSQSLELKELFEIALDKTVEVTGRERVNIRLRDALTGKVNLVSYRGFSEEEIEELRRRTLHHPMSEQVFASGNPLIVNDTGENHPKGLLERTRSVAWIPIKAGSRVVGVLGISDNQSKSFSSSEVKLLEAIGSVIGVAIENARLFDETKRNLERIRALREIDRAITSTLDLRTVLEVLLEKIDLVLPYSATTVRLLNKESGAIEPVACRNLDEKEWKAERWRGGRGIPNVVFETKAPVTISNVQSDPQNRDQEFFHKHGLVSYLGVPLIVQDEVLGVISFYTKEEHDFSNEEVEFLATLAGQAAIAIHNSQLYQEMIKLAADLSRSNKVKDEFLSVMSHELRTPLNVVMGYTGMIRDRLLGEINPDQEKALDKVLSRARDQLTMITSILQAVQMEAEGVRVERREVRLKDFLDDLRSGYSIPLGKELSVIWDYPSDLPVVHTDAEKLKHILQNLINNAIKFTEKGHVTISAVPVEKRGGADGQGGRGDSPQRPGTSAPLQSFVEFKVSDTGIGIREEYLSVIFERFRQVDSSETRSYGGIGIGLYIVKKFTDLLCGEVDVKSRVGKGSTFTVTIPCDNVPFAAERQNNMAVSSR